MAVQLRVIFIAFFLIYAVQTATSSNILGFFATPCRSHYIVHETLMKGLAANGRNVTVVTAAPTEKSKKLPANYHEIPLNLERRDMDKMVSRYLKEQEENSNNLLLNAPSFINTMVERAHESLKSDATQQLLRSGQKFDLLVLGWFFNDFQLGLAAHFQCPSVVIASLPALKPLRDFVANPSGMPLIPVMIRAPKGVPSFWQRSMNVLGSMVEFIVIEITNRFVHQRYYELHFPAAENYPSFDEVKRNVSLVLVNDHFSEGVIRPNMPNFRGIAGIHINRVPNALPSELQSFLDEAEHGAILFSLGTNVKSSDLPQEKLKTLLSVFGKLKQRVIWKWDGDSIPPEKTENILMTNWLPQNDVLAHRSTRLFISHCGLGGIIEAKFHGVPILAIPVFGDQPKNAKAIVSEGWAIEMNYSEMNADELSFTIDELLTNETYTKTVAALSQIYRDRPQTALEEAIFWTEYVLRHNGARHMQSAAIELTFIQQNSLDVFAAFILLLYVVVKIIKWTVIKSISCCFGKRETLEKLEKPRKSQKKSQKKVKKI